MTEPADRLRLDKWLWHARVVRTRALAQDLARPGHVRVNGERASAASKAVRIGDVLTGPAPAPGAMSTHPPRAPPPSARGPGLASGDPEEH